VRSDPGQICREKLRNKHLVISYGCLFIKGVSFVFYLTSYIGIFMSLRERKRERGGERVRESKRESESKSKRFYVLEREREQERERAKARARKGKGKTGRERTKAQVIIFLNRTGQSEKSANILHCT
jgi:hypothetical protein